jgi:hypothetical protein
VLERRRDKQSNVGYRLKAAGVLMHVTFSYKQHPPIPDRRTLYCIAICPATDPPIYLVLQRAVRTYPP